MPLKGKFDRRQDGGTEPRRKPAVDEAPVPAPAPTSAPSRGGRDYAEVGQHVQTVLAAAESAAETLRANAEHEAQRVREAAAKAAQDLREQAAADAEADRGEARRQLAVAKEEARSIRQDAEAYAEVRKREADVQATRVVREAEQKAAEIADAAAERNQVLLNDIELSEMRMREFAANLRDVADRLDAVAVSSRGDEDVDGEPEEPLDNALTRRATDEATTDAAVR